MKKFSGWVLRFKSVNSLPEFNGMYFNGNCLTKSLDKAYVFDNRYIAIQLKANWSKDSNTYDIVPVEVTTTTKKKIQISVEKST